MFVGLKFRAHHDVLQSIDNGTYAGSNEITLTIPIDLPYPMYEDEFKRVTGDFKYQGVHYKLVKQKLQHDKLIVVCIKDENQTKIDNTLSKVARAVNDQENSSKTALTVLAKIFKDFQTTESTLIAPGNRWSRGINPAVVLHLSPQENIRALFQPPRFC